MSNYFEDFEDEFNGDDDIESLDSLFPNDEDDNFEDIDTSGNKKFDEFGFEEAKENSRESDEADGLESPEESWKEKYRTSLWTVGLGICVLVLVAILVRVKVGIKNVKNESEGYTTETQGVQQTTQETKEVTASKPVQTTPINTNSWVSISKPELKEFKTLNGIFTVTNVEYYAQISNTTNDKQIKGIVTGSISGLSGTYELEIPFTKAQNLSVGTSFSIEYSISESEKYKVYEITKY